MPCDSIILHVVDCVAFINFMSYNTAMPPYWHHS